MSTHNPAAPLTCQPRQTTLPPGWIASLCWAAHQPLQTHRAPASAAQVAAVARPPPLPQPLSAPPAGELGVQGWPASTFSTTTSKARGCCGRCLSSRFSCCAAATAVAAAEVLSCPNALECSIIKWADLRLGNRLGSGSFGQVILRLLAACCLPLQLQSAWDCMLNLPKRTPLLNLVPRCTWPRGTRRRWPPRRWCRSGQACTATRPLVR